jgi:hypothetical protein
MVEKLSKTEKTNWTETDTKRTLFRVAAFLFVFLATHWLLMWLHPMGAHKFFWNLAIAALASWILVRRLLPRLDTQHSKAERNQTL